MYTRLFFCVNENVDEILRSIFLHVDCLCFAFSRNDFLIYMNFKYEMHPNDNVYKKQTLGTIMYCICST